MEKSVSPVKKEMYLYNKDQASFGNTATNKAAEEKERDAKERMEKYIWTCVPDRRLYQRDGA